MGARGEGLKFVDVFKTPLRSGEREGRGAKRREGEVRQQDTIVRFRVYGSTMAAAAGEAMWVMPVLRPVLWRITAEAMAKPAG